MCGRATFAIAVSRSSMKVASVTVIAIIHGLTTGRSAVTAKGCAMAAMAVSVLLAE